MRVAQLTTYDDTGGAARSALRLHAALRRDGIDSVTFARSARRIDDPTIQSPRSAFAKGYGLVRAFVDARVPGLLHPDRPRVPFGCALLPERASATLSAASPDLVHVHWIGEGFVRPESLARLGVPVVWTLHDSWALTGGCHLPGTCTRFREACGACPALASARDGDLSRWGWNRKARAWRDLRLAFVAPSRWMAERARASGLGRDQRIEVIPNGVDPSVYRPVPRRLARAVLGLPPDAVVVLLSAHAVGADPNKGVPMLVSALGLLSRTVPRLHLAVAGSSGGIQDPPVPVRYLGPLADDYAMVLAYAAADVVAIPSREENLPNAAMEALACGRPVAAFRVGGIPELVRDRATGALAEPQDPADLAQAIGWVVGDRTRWRQLAAEARASAETEYAADRIAKRHADLYRELLTPSGGTFPTPSP